MGLGDAVGESQDVGANSSAWEEYLDENSGDTYYHNAETGETSWNKPSDFKGIDC